MREKAKSFLKPIRLFDGCKTYSKNGCLKLTIADCNLQLTPIQYELSFAHTYLKILRIGYWVQYLNYSTPFLLLKLSLLITTKTPSHHLMNISICLRQSTCLCNLSIYCSLGINEDDHLKI